MSVINNTFLPGKLKPKVVRFCLNYDLKNLFLDVVNEKDRHLYEEFICKVRDLGQEIRDDELVQILKEARNCISILDRSFILFVQVILLLRWGHRGDDVVQEYQGFLLDLCSAHSYHSKNVIDHLVNNFKICTNLESGVPPQEELKQFINVHNVIKTILSVIPMSSDLLIKSINDNYPYLKRSKEEHASYLYNVLSVIDYWPNFRLEILKIVTQKLINLDAVTTKENVELCSTLDLSLNVYLTFIKNECYNGSELNFNKTKILYGDLIKVFESLLISTHGTNHIQFIIFYILSFKSVLPLGFLQLLWGKVNNPNVAPIIRQACVSYIASLLSRGGYIKIDIVRDVLSEMSEFVHNYIQNYESTAVLHDTRIHGVFYAVCQGIFYVIAFRHKELIDSKKGLQFLNNLNLSKMVQSRLNPLRACQPIVARNFANITRAYQLAYCYSIMERNARSFLPQVTRDNSGNEIILQPFLETFFPFDPYNLPLSGKFIKPIYREYDEEIIEEEMELQEEDDFLDPNTMLSQSPRSAFQYGNHPGFLHHVT